MEVFLSRLCDVDEGDCDHDNECADKLVCGTANCSCGTANDWRTTADCCMGKPTVVKERCGEQRGEKIFFRTIFRTILLVVFHLLKLNRCKKNA